MPSAKEIKERIAGVQETMKITNAMYLISSSKVKQAKQRLAETEPFFFAMQDEISKILTYWPNLNNKYFDKRASVPDDKKNIGIIVITADKGLAGSYNLNVIRLAEKIATKPGKDRLFVLGEVGRHYFAPKKDKIELDQSFKYTVQNPTLSRARSMAGDLIELFHRKELDEIHVVYTNMESSLKASPKHIQLLPLVKNEFEDADIAGKLTPTFYPSPEDVMDSIVPVYILGTLYGCLVESYCSEQNSRMLAMQNATDSATDMLKDLNTTYNRVRQADITQELTEVVAGANAQQRK